MIGPPRRYNFTIAPGGRLGMGGGGNQRGGGIAGMSYDTSRLRGVHPPACTCVQCSEGRNRGRGRGGRGGGNSGGGGKRGCLPLLALASVAAAVILAAALV